MINASDSPHSPSPSHGDQSSEDKDAISAASIVSRGVKKRFKYSCVSSNALSIRSSIAARRHNTHNNAYIYVCIYTNGASIKIGDRQRSLRLCLFRGESNERNVESSRFSFLKFVELKENDWEGRIFKIEDSFYKVVNLEERERERRIFNNSPRSGII